MTDAEVAWVAGLLEGEGSFSLTGGKHPSLVIVCGMTDRDVVERLQAIVGAGVIYLQQPRKEGHKPCYSWRLANRPEVVQLLNELRPLMGDRRRARIDELLEFHAQSPVTKWRYKHGTKGVYSAQGCRCEECCDWHEAWCESRRVSSEDRKRQPPAHGTNSKYTEGCRCEPCTGAHGDYHRQYRDAKRGATVVKVLAA